MRTRRIRCEFESVLPRIRAHAQFAFRSVVCVHAREELIAETIALSWAWFRRLRQRGEKNPLTFVSAIATYAARAARSGRRLCGHERATEVFSPVAQRQHAFRVSPLSSYRGLSIKAFADAVPDDDRTPVAEQAAFRSDFPAWLSTFDDNRRRMIEAMAEGERTQDLAVTFQVSAGRIAQLRREFLADWLAFIGDC